MRIYVPGYGDMMPSTSNAFVLAAAMKKHNIKPVYDIWICGTAGEEGKGNLAGMKQLYGFDQKARHRIQSAEFRRQLRPGRWWHRQFHRQLPFRDEVQGAIATRGRSKRACGNGRGDSEDC